MSLVFSRSGALALLICLGVSGLPVSRTFGQGNQRPRRFIELSETNSAEVLTNLNQLTTRKEGLKELDDQLRSFNQLSGKKSFEERFSLPYVSANVPVVPTKTLKELLDRRKDWGLTPDELAPGLSAPDTDMLSVFGGDKVGDKTDDKTSSLQQFYDALNRSGPTRQTTGRSSDNTGSGFTRQLNNGHDSLATSDDDRLPPGLRDQAKKLQEQINGDPSSIFNPTQPRSSFENFFGLTGNNTAVASGTGSGAPKTSVDSFLDQFKKVMDSSSGLPQLDPKLQPLMQGVSAQTPVAVPGLDSLPTSTHHELTQTTPGEINRVLDQPTLPDFNSAVLNHWNPLYTPPKLELPKYTPPTPPDLVFPRRKF